MSPPRPLTAAVAAFLATGISIDPADPPPTPPRLHAPAVVAAVPAPPAIEPSKDPVPADVAVEVTPDGHGAHRVVVRRPGFLVSLRDEHARSAGKDWASLLMSSEPGRGGTRGRLIWETTRLDGLATTRGLVLLTGDGTSLTGELRAAAAPLPATTWKSARATCAGQHDGIGGFTVLCRFAKGVRVTGAANVTAARSLDDVWLVPGPSPLARLDLARSPGGAEGRVIGLTQGVTGVVLRVEASFAEGEEASLLIQESERAQPVAVF